MVTCELVFHYDHVADGEMQTKLDGLETELRQIGLYFDVIRVLADADGRIVVVLDCLIGDVAYSTRVQDPEQHKVDTTFRQMVGNAKVKVDEIREDLLRRAGKEEL